MDTFNLFYTFLELTVYGVSVIQVSSEMKFGGTAWISTGKQSAISLCRIVNLKKKKGEIGTVIILSPWPPRYLF